MLVSLVIGTLVLVPSLIYLYSLFQRGPAAAEPGSSEDTT
jgi:hypothetical protein